MSHWPDAKIRATALWYIGKHTMDPASWQYTLVGDAHPGALNRAELEPGERPLVSFFHSEASWYLFTTRRVVGEYSGTRVESAAPDVIVGRIGDFKGHGGAVLEVMTLRLFSGYEAALRHETGLAAIEAALQNEEAALQYETGRAAMAPIYYFRYWTIKYPILDKLKADPGEAPDLSRM